LSPDLEQAFQDISAGNADAYTFCRSAFEFFHLIDDLVDRDKPVAPNDLVICLLKFIDVLTRNEFYQSHRDDLFAFIYSSAMAYAASLRLAQDEDIQRKVASEVLKSQYQDLFFRVAFWTGGSRHAIDMDAKHRGYCFG
jgi:hypothetical protein